MGGCNSIIVAIAQSVFTQLGIGAAFLVFSASLCLVHIAVDAAKYGVPL